MNRKLEKSSDLGALLLHDTAFVLSMKLRKWFPEAPTRRSKRGDTNIPGNSRWFMDVHFRMPFGNGYLQPRPDSNP